MAQREFEQLTKGTVARDRKGYYLKAGRRRTKIPTDLLTTRGEVGKLVGKEVAIAYSEKDPTSVVAIGYQSARVERPRWILCYIPAPELMTELRPALRESLLRKLVGQEVLSRSLAREIRRGF